MFDIHDYGDRIVGALNAVGQRRSFASIVAGLDNFEACKYMLASLQLVKHTHAEILTNQIPFRNNSTQTLTRFSFSCRSVE